MASQSLTHCNDWYQEQYDLQVHCWSVADLEFFDEWDNLKRKWGRNKLFMSLEIQSFPSSSLRLKSVIRRVACLYHKTTTELQRKVWWYGPPEMYGSSCIVCPNKFWIFMPKSKGNVWLEKYWMSQQILNFQKLKMKSRIIFKGEWDSGHSRVFHVRSTTSLVKIGMVNQLSPIPTWPSPPKKSAKIEVM